MYFNNVFLALCIAQVFLFNSGNAKSSCDYLQTNPPSTIVDLVTICHLKNIVGYQQFYKLAGCLLSEDNIIDENNTFNYKAMMNKLPQEILNSPDFTEDYWLIVKDCSKLKGHNPAETAEIIHECIDAGKNGENDFNFVQD